MRGEAKWVEWGVRGSDPLPKTLLEGSSGPTLVNIQDLEFYDYVDFGVHGGFRCLVADRRYRGIASRRSLRDTPSIS